MSKIQDNTIYVELIIIYNANSDLLSKISDFAHKTLSPNTYSCSLCRLTHGPLTMRNEWSKFLEGLPFKIRFEYRDTQEGKEERKFPLILMKDGINKKIIASPENLNQIKTLQELIDLVKTGCRQIP